MVTMLAQIEALVKIQAQVPLVLQYLVDQEIPYLHQLFLNKKVLEWIEDHQELLSVAPGMVEIPPIVISSFDILVGHQYQRLRHKVESHQELI